MSLGFRAEESWVSKAQKKKNCISGVILLLLFSTYNIFQKIIEMKCWVV